MEELHRPCEFEGESADIYHTPGYKDDFMVEVKPHGDVWRPTNYEIFTYLFMWFRSEEYEFGEHGHGASLLWFYMSLCHIDREAMETARDAYGLRGEEAKEHFHESVEKYADELIEELEELKQAANAD